MRIGLVCPYSWDVPGGVQFHVRDLAEHFLRAGPRRLGARPRRRRQRPCPTTSPRAGRPVPVRYNGSVARVTFGPATTARVNRWLEAGRFDVLHLHEPLNPSASLMALWASTEPVVATFHSAMLRSRALHAAHPLLRPSLEKIRGRIAVSEDARATVQRHLGGEAFIIPNGVYVDRFGDADRRPRVDRHRRRRPPWRSSGGSTSRARASRSRSGRCPPCSTPHPGARLLVAGPGDASDLLRGGRPAGGGRDAGARHRHRRRQGLPAALGRRLRRTAPRRRELRHRARRGDGRRCTGRGVRPAGVRRGARRGRTGILFETGSQRRASPGPARAPRRPRRAATGCARRAGAGAGLRLGAWWPTGSWRSTRPSSPAPTASPRSRRRRTCGGVSCAVSRGPAADGRRPAAGDLRRHPRHRRRLVPVVLRRPARPAARQGRGRDVGARRRAGAPGRGRARAREQRRARPRQRPAHRRRRDRVARAHHRAAGHRTTCSRASTSVVASRSRATSARRCGRR